MSKFNLVQMLKREKFMMMMMEAVVVVTMEVIQTKEVIQIQVVHHQIYGLLA